MSENRNLSLPYHVSFMNHTNIIYQDFSDNDANILPNKKSSNIMHRTISNPTIYEPEINSDFSNYSSDDEEKTLNPSLRKMTPVSSDQLCCKRNISETLQIQDSDEKYKMISNSIYKKYSKACIPAKVKNKLSLQRYRQIAISLGRREINKNQIQKINVYSKKTQAGFELLKRVPVFIDDSDSNEESDSFYNNLEQVIQKLKNEDISLIEISPNNVKNESTDDIEICQYSEDICKINSDIDSTKKQFIEMETNIISDLSSIKSSIDKIIEERKEIQKQHRIWLTNMKKKICQTKEKTKKIEGYSNTKLCLITYF